MAPPVLTTSRLDGTAASTLPQVESVSGFAHTFLPGRKVDDAVEAAVAFANGSVGTLEATRFAHGRRNAFQWELNGTKGSTSLAGRIDLFDENRQAETQRAADAAVPVSRPTNILDVIAGQLKRKLGFSPSTFVLSTIERHVAATGFAAAEAALTKRHP